MNLLDLPKDILRLFIRENLSHRGFYSFSTTNETLSSLCLHEKTQAFLRKKFLRVRISLDDHDRCIWHYLPNGTKEGLEITIIQRYSTCLTAITEWNQGVMIFHITANWTYGGRLYEIYHDEILFRHDIGTGPPGPGPSGIYARRDLLEGTQEWIQNPNEIARLYDQMIHKCRNRLPAGSLDHSVRTWF